MDFFSPPSHTLFRFLFLFFFFAAIAIPRGNWVALATRQKGKKEREDIKRRTLARENKRCDSRYIVLPIKKKKKKKRRKRYTHLKKGEMKPQLHLKGQRCNFRVVTVCERLASCKAKETGFSVHEGSSRGLAKRRQKKADSVARPLSFKA